MGQVIRTSVSLSAWPELDQRLWYSATTKGEFLAPDGKAAHWAPETKRQVEKGCGDVNHYRFSFGLADRYDDPYGDIAL